MGEFFARAFLAVVFTALFAGVYSLLRVILVALFRPLADRLGMEQEYEPLVNGLAAGILAAAVFMNA